MATKASKDRTELSELDLASLVDRLRAAKQEALNLRFRSATGQLDNHSELRRVRRRRPPDQVARPLLPDDRPRHPPVTVDGKDGLPRTRSAWQFRPAHAGRARGSHVRGRRAAGRELHQLLGREPTVSVASGGENA